MVKSIIREWTLERLYEQRNQLDFPVYQRNDVWNVNKRSLLIDSILKGIDIPKIYLHKVESQKRWDCIDGHQRIDSIIGYFDNDFAWEGKKFFEISPEQQETIKKYRLTIVEIAEITSEEVRELFRRLNLGIALNSGEKLNAIASKMRDFVEQMTKSRFIQTINVPSRRFAKEQICAQICNNSSFINKSGEFRNSKFDDLQNLYRTQSNFDHNSQAANGILSVLEKLDEIFGNEANKIRNRASTISLYFLVEEMMKTGEINGKEKKLKKFYLEFLRELKKQVKLGIDFTNRFLMRYQTYIIQAADSKRAITERQSDLDKAFKFYFETGEIINA